MFWFTDLFEMMHQAWSSIEEVLYCFSRASIKFQDHTGQKNHSFWPKLGISRLKLQLEFTDGYEMVQKAVSNIGEVPYYLLRSSIKCQGHTGQKITDFDPNWAFPDCNLIFDLPMALKWCTELEVA